jgi:hypothetical protein
MARAEGVKNSKKKPIEQYDHKGKKRANNPPVGLVTPETDPPGAPEENLRLRSAPRPATCLGGQSRADVLLSSHRFAPRPRAN